MLPESRILKNQYHNERIVSLILEQKVEMDPLTGTPKFWKKQPLPSEAEINAEIHKMYNQIQDKYGIPGLVGNYPRYVSKSLVMATEKKYGKEYAKKRFPRGVPVYDSWEDYCAEIIYLSKGTVSDIETNAMQAILAIKSADSFNKVNKALQKKTGGMGIGQYISSFFGTYTNNYIKQLADHDISTKLSPQSSIYLEIMGNRNHWKTETRLHKILEHLKKIGANPNSITILQKTYNVIKYVASLEKKIWKSSFSKQIVDHKHEIALVASIVAPFFGPLGIAISTGIMLGDAAIYAHEGDYLSSGMSAIFALLPVVGTIPKLIPGIARLEARGMAALGKKLATSKNPVLNKLELSIIKDMAKYQNVIKQDLNAYFERRFQNEMIHAIKNAKYPALQKLIYKLGTGTIRASVLGGKLIKGGIKTFAPYEISANVWNKFYTGSFLQTTQQELEFIKNIKQTYKK